MTAGFGEAYGAEQIRRRSSLLRTSIKSFYLRNLLRYCEGPAIDLGCGAGQLLERLPPGSIGLELNDTLIAYLRGLGLPAVKYDAYADDFGLSPLFEAGRGGYRHLLCAHVLEHFDDPVHAFRRLAQSCARLGVQSLTFVVPGEKGFKTDATHKVFVTEAFVRSNGLDDCAPYRLAAVDYFPGNIRQLGAWFAYHECILTWRR